MAEREQPERAPQTTRGRRSRGVALDVHRPLEAAIGIAAMVVPFLLSFGSGQAIDFSTEAIVIAAVIGAPIATLGFAGSRTGSPLSPDLHSVLDRLLAGALVLAAIAFAAGGDAAAAIFLALAAAALGALALTTRYTE